MKNFLSFFKKTKLPVQVVIEQPVKSLNKIQQSIVELNTNTYDKERKVLSISKQIKDLIGVSPSSIPHDWKYKFGKHTLYVQNRCFSDGWHNVFELSDVFNGTTHTNIPSDKYLNEFLHDLKSHLLN